jgi:hypothetical protein
MPDPHSNDNEKAPLNEARAIGAAVVDPAAEALRQQLVKAGRDGEAQRVHRDAAKTQAAG